MHSPSTTKMVLLLDQDSSYNGSLSQWLSRNGYAAIVADDVCQVIEELSDFTVKLNPDVVLLQVPSLPECFEDLQHSLRKTVNLSDLKVVGLCDRKNKVARKRYFANDLEQLHTIMHREVPAVA
jgi:DNA-binding response OmpR family regulator